MQDHPPARADMLLANKTVASPNLGGALSRLSLMIGAGACGGHNFPLVRTAWPLAGTGRQTGLKIRGFRACGFESHSGHHPPPQKTRPKGARLVCL